MNDASAPLAGTYEWTDLDLLQPAAREALAGSGSPFELVLENVLGASVPVFVQRPGNLRDALVAAGEKHAEKVFLVGPDGEEVTFSGAVARVAAVARHLADDLGVRKGDRVGLASANTLDYVLVFLASASLGAVAVNLNSWWTASEMAAGVEMTDPVVVFADDRRIALFQQLPARKVGAWPGVAPMAGASGRQPARATGGAPFPHVSVGEDEPLIILFTSGTTGRAKGATISHRNLIHLSMAIMLAGAVRQASGQVGRSDLQPSGIIVGPLFHLSGIAPLVTALFSGMKLVIPPSGRWSAEATLALIERHRVTNLTVVPTQIWLLLQNERFHSFDTSSLRSIGGGGATCPPELARLMRSSLPHAMGTQGYGMTETTGMGTRIAGAAFEARPETVGTVEATMSLQIRDDRGAVLPPGQVGEIYLRGAGVFLGYWDNPEATAAAVDAERWYRTGDFGRSDGKFIVLESRMRDLIIRGGENVYPIEIESRLVEHAGIADAAVVGVAHAILGQEVKAFVVPVAGTAASVEEIRAFVGETLAAYKVPTYVEFLAALPYNATGKVLKRELERSAADGERAQTVPT